MQTMKRRIALVGLALLGLLAFLGLGAAMHGSRALSVEAHVPESTGADAPLLNVAGGRRGADAGAVPGSGAGERVQALARTDGSTVLVRLEAVDVTSLLPLRSARARMQGDVDGAIDFQADADGRLFCAAPWSSAPATLLVECQGYQSVRWSGALPRLSVVDLGVIPLVRVGGVVGAVHMPGGEPMEGVEVVVVRPDADSVPARSAWQSCGMRTATTDAAGRFSIPHLEVGSWRVQPRTPFSRSAFADFVVAAGDVAEVAVVLPRDSEQLRGRATDTLGRALAGVYVGTEDQSAEAMFTKTDDQGRFWLVRRSDAPKVAQFRLMVRDYDGVAEVAHGWSEELVRWGDDGLDVRFRRRDPVRVRVTDAEGNPVPEFRASCRWQGRPDGVRDVSTTCRSETGVATLAGVPPGRSILRIDAGASDVAASVERDVEVPPTGGIEIPVVLPPVLRGQLLVVDEVDVPVSACNVEWMRAVEGIAIDAGDAPSTGLLRPLGSGITDATGRLQMVTTAGTPMDIVVRGPGCVPQAMTGATLVDGEILRLQVRRGGSIQGRVVPQAAVDFMWVDALGRSQGDRWRVVLLPVGMPEAQARPCELGADGAFEADGLAVGEWRVRLLGPGVHGDLGTVVAATPALRMDFAADWVVPANVRGFAVLPPDLMARGCMLSLVNGRVDIAVPIGSDGAFRVRAPSGSYHARIVVPGVATQPPTWFDFGDVVDLPPGDRSVTLVPQKRRGVLRLVNTDRQPMAGLQVTLDVERALGRWRTYTADESGRIILDPAPTGAFKVLHEGPQGMRELATLAIVADGEQATIVVP